MATKDGVPFPTLCRLHDLPAPIPEYGFAAPDHRWRFDWAWLRRQVALEVNGGIWIQGRHTRGAGYLRDLAKLNEAQIRGWIVLQRTPQTLAEDETFTLIRRALEARA
jgi:hypothetical protein